jgi:hypothetical protein
VNTAQLQAFVAAHKVGVLGTAAAGAVLLGLRTRRKATAGGAATSQPAGTLPAAAVVPANGLQGVGSTYDSSAYDVYSALQSELTPFLQGQAAQTDASSTGIAAAVLPVASTLFAPTYSGNYVKDAKTGLIGEVETDGSVFGFTPAQWSTAAGKGGGTSLNTIGHIGQAYSTEGNLARVATPAPAKS